MNVMEPELQQKFEEQEGKLNQIYASVEKMRKYFLWTLVITLATVVLPLIGLVFVIPWFLHTILSTYSLSS